MIYVITGTSSGMGKAFAELFLENGDSVIGISRRNSIDHPNFTFLECDLSDTQQLEALSFKELIQANDSIRLINNAGIIGEIQHSSKSSLIHYEKLAITNIVAPQYLSSLIIREFGNQVDAIINISSGAAQRPVPSWSAYGASKAAIDSFSETLKEEIKEAGGKTKVFSIAPGVVDTSMQEVIRNSSPKDFSNHQKFVDLKENNQLRSPKEVAKLLNNFFLSEDYFKNEVIFRL